VLGAAACTSYETFIAYKNLQHVGFRLSCENLLITIAYTYEMLHIKEYIDAYHK